MSIIKISILTPSYNQAKYLERNILSVLNQNYPSFEHIIIDGGSTDGTIDILKKYPHLKWVSEKDNGQADALNKGLKMVAGEIIGWINSDDFYENYIFESVSEEFNDLSTQWIIGDVTIFDEGSGEKIPIRSVPVTYRGLLKNPDIIKQPAAFFRKSFLEHSGGWDSALHMVMDYDLWLRLSKNNAPKMVNKQWAYFTLQAEQKTLGANLLRQSREMRMVMKKAGAPLRYRIIIIFKKYLYFVKFMFKSAVINRGMLPKKYLRLNLINRKSY
jgi:glycosyltransferase involved in cell wall biosynthesis